MKAKIAVLAGDGIGPEVMREALRVLAAVEQKFGHSFEIHEALVGGAAYDVYQSHFPIETETICSDCDAILFGAVGGPNEERSLAKWENCERNSLLAIRKSFSFNVNIRPSRVYPQLQAICPLRDELVRDGVDLVVFRELLGDIYFGEHRRFQVDSESAASDTAEYRESQIVSIARKAFEAAGVRRKKVTSVDKANVLATSQLWREVVAEVSKDYSDIELEHMFVDNCAMQLVVNPQQFDVILTGNLFGDILSDTAAVLPGSLGLLPSASISEDGFAMYEPSGGSAPDIAGENVANPSAQILCVAMMLRYSFGLEEEASSIETALDEVLSSGARTKDIYSKGDELLSSSAFCDRLLERCSA